VDSATPSGEFNPSRRDKFHAVEIDDVGAWQYQIVFEPAPERRLAGAVVDDVEAVLIDRRHIVRADQDAPADAADFRQADRAVLDLTEKMSTVLVSSCDD